MNISSQQANVGFLPSAVLRGLESLRSEQQLCDIAIKSGDVTFHAHRIVLAAISPFFRALFSGSFFESEKEELELNDTEPNVIEALLNFIYTAHLEGDSEELVGLLELADFLQISCLKCLCAEYLKNNINENNCFKICQLAQSLGLQELYKRATHFIDTCRDGRVATSVFESGDLQIVVVAGGCDSEGHSLKTAECLTTVDHLLRWRHSRPPLTGTAAKATDTLAVMAEARSEAAYASTSSDLYVVGGRAAVGKFLSSVESFNLLQNEWRSHNSLPIALCGAAAVIASNKLYVIGGRTIHDWEARVWIYNLTSNKWNEGPRLPEKRVDHSAVVWHNAIYVIGGKTESELAAASSVLLLESGSTEWVSVAPLQQARSQFACGVANGFVFVVGGQDGTHLLPQAEKYDLIEDKWLKVVDPSFPVKGNCAVKLVGHTKDKFLCIGGVYEDEVINRVEKLGMGGMSWHLMPELNTPRSHCAVAVFSGSVDLEQPIVFPPGKYCCDSNPIFNN